MSDRPVPAEPTLADVLEALRKVYAKLLEVERRLQALEPSKHPAARAAGQLIETKRSVKPNPEHALLRAKLMAAWAQIKGSNYTFDGRDANAVAKLLKRSLTHEEIVARWSRAIGEGCGSIYLFDLNFAKWAPSTTSNRPVVAGDVYGDQA